MGNEIFASDLKVNEFCDVGTVVADALKVLGHEQHMRASADRARVFNHVGEHFPEQGIIVLIDVVIALPDRLGGLGIAGRIGIQHHVQLQRNRARHAGHTVAHGDRHGLIQHQRTLADIL